MKAIPLAAYDAFSATAFGGSQAAVLTDAASIDRPERRRIAREIGMPATAFVDAYGEDWIQVQFMSTLMELPMCGHGTLCLLTHMLESGLMPFGGEVELRLPKSSARASVNETGGGRLQVMLDIRPPAFESAPPHTGDLLTVLGLGADALSQQWPLETARGDFIHLVVPLTGLDAMRAIRPDFNGMVRFCQAHGIETIAVFCLETEDPHRQLHVRDFCPAVGVGESAAAGTTNAALSSYLLRHALVPTDTSMIRVSAEQGLELGRPSSIHSRITLGSSGQIERLQVGGVATAVFKGEIFL
ncbi:MAG: PhzF family phenazine biosynthesis protein [Gammaproteobacteria bacterium]|nr:PhzF family phenazine biosynthesis protein [Gammaproteobacteria bacterium]